MLRKIVIGVVVTIAVLGGAARLVNMNSYQVTEEDGSTHRVDKSSMTSLSPNVSTANDGGAPYVAVGATLSDEDVAAMSGWILAQPAYADACAIAVQDTDSVLTALREDVEAGIAGNQNTLAQAHLVAGTSAALTNHCS